VLTGDTKAIESLAFGPDGNLIATASLDDTVRIWNARTGQLLRILDHPDGVYDVAFSPDGTQVATLDYAGVIRIFPTCPDCTNPTALLALAHTRVTRSLTPQEGKEFGIP
jgi:WD40 repeat protein